jgi:CheY-like chemotaxis protein
MPVTLSVPFRISAADGITVAGEASDGQAAVELAAELEPDVVIMDLQLPGLHGIDATRQILAARPRTAVLVLTMFEDDEMVFSAVSAGAVGYLLKGADRADIVTAVRAAGAARPCSAQPSHSGCAPGSPAARRRWRRRSRNSPHASAPRGRSDSHNGQGACRRERMSAWRPSVSLDLEEAWPGDEHADAEYRADGRDLGEVVEVGRTPPAGEPGPHG